MRFYFFRSSFGAAGLAAAVFLMFTGCRDQRGGVPSPPSSAGGTAAGNSAATPSAAASTNVPTMEANQSVMVVKDLGFGRQPPVLEAVLREIDRRYQPETGAGRTFAILEAFTQPDPVSTNINLCLRISSERAGIGEIVYRRTGETLWKSRITPATHQTGFTGGSLTILFDMGDGKTSTVDGSMNPPTIFDAMLKEAGVPVAQAWPEGEVRDFIFIYSACGCPIHVKCRREGEKATRVEKATQIIFPDDPGAVQVINRLMGW